MRIMRRAVSSATHAKRLRDFCELVDLRHRAILREIGVIGQARGRGPRRVHFGDQRHRFIDGDFRVDLLWRSIMRSPMLSPPSGLIGFATFVASAWKWLTRISLLVLGRP
jgi:hypothetical protein